MTFVKQSAADVQVWCVRLPSDAPPAGMLAFLPEHERRALQAIPDPLERGRRLTGRVCLRVAVGAAVGVSPPELELSRTRAGKPFVAGSRWRFNLSHSGNWCLLALTDQGEVGVDVEQLRPLVDWPRLAAQVLAAPERRALQGGGVEDFYRCWVRREAILKAVGTGLVDDPEAVTLCGEPCGEMGQAWEGLGQQGWVASFALNGHLAALAGVNFRPGAWVQQVTLKTFLEGSFPSMGGFYVY